MYNMNNILHSWEAFGACDVNMVCPYTYLKFNDVVLQIQKGQYVLQHKVSPLSVIKKAVSTYIF